MAMSMRTSGFSITPRGIRAFLIAVLWLCIGGYFGWHVYSLFRAPVLVVENPSRDIITKDMSLTLSGYAQKESEVTVNGGHIDTTEKGVFRDDIALETGMNVIEVKVVNKFGKETTVVRRVVKE